MFLKVVNAVVMRFSVSAKGFQTLRLVVPNSGEPVTVTAMRDDIDFAPLAGKGIFSGEFSVQPDYFNDRFSFRVIGFVPAAVATK